MVYSKAISWLDLIDQYRNHDHVPLKEMSVIEKKDYMRQLWRRLGIIVHVRGLCLKLEQETVEMRRGQFGLDPNIKQCLDGDKPQDGLEENLVIEKDDNILTDLPWYIINPDSLVYKVQTI